MSESNCRLLFLVNHHLLIVRIRIFIRIIFILRIVFAGSMFLPVAFVSVVPFVRRNGERVILYKPLVFVSSSSPRPLSRLSLTLPCFRNSSLVSFSSVPMHGF